MTGLDIEYWLGGGKTRVRLSMREKHMHLIKKNRILKNNKPKSKRVTQNCINIKLFDWILRIKLN